MTPRCPLYSISSQYGFCGPSVSALHCWQRTFTCALFGIVARTGLQFPLEGSAVHAPALLARSWTFAAQTGIIGVYEPVFGFGILSVDEGASVSVVLPDGLQWLPMLTLT